MKDSSSTSAPGGAPTSARYIVLYFAVTLAIITYVDRICISQAAPAMQADLGLSKIEMGYAFTAFGLAYSLFEIPGGWLGDKIGPRKVLMRVVTMWSIFTVATGWARSLWALIVCRFLFGVGEAGCFPNLTKAFTLWFHASERVKAQGIMWLSARWGGAFTPLLVGWMLAGGDGKPGLGLHYKWVFLIFGALGVVWAVAFYSWFRDHPHEHPSVNAAELAEIGHTDKVGEGHAMPWEKLLTSRTVWMLWLQYFFMSYTWYFFVTWFPTYLKESFPTMSEMERALLACVPLFCGGIGCIISGFVAAPFEKLFGGRSRARRIVGVAGFTVSGLMMLVSTQLLNLPVMSVFAVGIASLSSDLTLPGSWGACMEVGGRYTGALSGSMNMVGNAGGALAPMVVPLVLAATGNNWGANMLVFAVAYFFAAACWLFINSDERLQDDAAHA